MKALSSWFHSQARRQRRTRYLEDALLGDQFPAYAWYRLRFFFARYLAAAIVHGIKFLFIYNIFSQRGLVVILLAHASAGLVSSFWWGALEVMRARVRRLYRHGKVHLISGEITRWLTLASLLSMVALGAGAGLLLWSVGDQGTFGVAQLYAFSILLRLSLEFVTRTFHSGVYAIRRIYRPLRAIVAVELVGLAAVLALWPVVGAWGFPAALMVGSVTIAGLTIHYTTRAYRLLGLPLPERITFDRLREVPGGSAGEFFRSGLSYALMKMDSVLVLGLFGVSAQLSEGPSLFVLFFVMGPTVQAGFDWAQLFYFDLKRLELRPFATLRIRYERWVLGLSWALGILFWGLGSLTGAVLYPTSLGYLYWLLLPFFVSRSLLAYIQIEAFAERRYGGLLTSALWWLLGFFAIAVGIEDDRWKLVVLSAVTLLVFAVLRTRRSGPLPDWSSPEPIGFAEWLEQVTGVDQAVRIRNVELSTLSPTYDSAIPNDGTQWLPRRLAQRIAHKVGRHGAVTTIAPNRVAWYERATAPAGLRDEWIMAVSGGLVRDLSDTGLCESGRSAVREAQSRSLFGRNSAHWATGNGPISVERVKQAFLAAFPTGAIYEPDQPPPPFFTDLSPAERRRILVAAMAFVRDFSARLKKSQFDVTALCMGGDLRLIFVVDRACSDRLRSRWRTLVKQLTVEAALGSVVK